MGRSSGTWRLAIAASWLAVAGSISGAPQPLLGVGGPRRLEAQSISSKKLATSLQRVYGRDVTWDTAPGGRGVVLRVFRADSLLGYAQVRDAMGKDQPITYLVATDTALVLRDIDILTYREAYGGEVAYEGWRKQFRGRGPDAPLEVGRDIRGISGATISVHAVTLGVRQALAELQAWRREGRL